MLEAVRRLGSFLAVLGATRMRCWAQVWPTCKCRRTEDAGFSKFLPNQTVFECLLKILRVAFEASWWCFWGALGVLEEVSGASWVVLGVSWTPGGRLEAVLGVSGNVWVREGGLCLRAGPGSEGKASGAW